MHGTLLWTNPEGMDKFSYSNKKLSLDLSGYKSICIISTNHYRPGSQSTTNYFNIGENGTMVFCYYDPLQNSTAQYGTFRHVIVESDGITFGWGCYNSGNYYTDTVCIPYQIYGLDTEVTSFGNIYFDK